jgi:hypothetical protein
MLIFSPIFLAKIFENHNIGPWTVPTATVSGSSGDQVSGGIIIISSHGERDGGVEVEEVKLAAEICCCQQMLIPELSSKCNFSPKCILFP